MNFLEDLFIRLRANLPNNSLLEIVVLLGLDSDWPFVVICCCIESVVECCLEVALF